MADFLRSGFGFDLEDTYMNGNKDYRKIVEHRIPAANLLASRAWGRLAAARRRVAPTFEQMLADPTLQFDKDGEVLASILAYQQRNPSPEHDGAA